MTYILLSSVATVDCDGNAMKLSLAKKGSFETIRLKGKDCEFKGDSQEIKTDLDKCGTTVSFNNTHITYKNQMTGIPHNIDYNNGIHRGGELKIGFECCYSRIGVTEHGSWEVAGETVVERVEGAGSLRFLLDIYKGDNFAEKFVHFPFEFMSLINDDIYMEVSLDSKDPHLFLVVVNVQATDGQTEDEGSLSYDLVREGCIEDSTFKFINTDSDSLPLSKFKRFTFKAFSFLNHPSEVYIHAVVKVCRISDNSFGCTDLCTKSKRKRYVDATSDLNDEQFHVYQGPIVYGDLIKNRLSSGADAKLESKIWILFILLVIILH